MKILYIGISRGFETNNDCKDINLRSLKILTEYYHASMDYLMGFTENRQHPNTWLIDLHLDDGAVELLRSGRINNRLLCKIMKHESFVRLIVDAKIYVDRIAGMHTRDMNVTYKAICQTLIEERHLNEDNLSVRLHWLLYEKTSSDITISESMKVFL